MGKGNREETVKDVWAESETVLALRTCRADGTSHNGYRYKLTVGAVAEAADWNPEPTCGGGLHVLVEGQGNWELLNWSPDALALIVRVRRDEIVRIDDAKCKVPRLRIEEITTVSQALCQLACDSAAIDRIVQEALRRAKKGGESASGDVSQLAASGYASQLAASGTGSKLAASGYASQLAASGDGSKLAASGTVSQLAASGTASQLAASGDVSQLAASGDGSLILGSYRSIAKAGEGGCIALAWHDGGRPRVSVGYVGEGLKPHTWYRLDDRGEFVEVLNAPEAPSR